MTNFEFVFSLFGLLLGLSLAELLGGFGRAVQRRAKLRIGWLAPMLGLLILLDVASFWLVAWSVRDAMQIAYFPMMIGLLICCLYYLVATLVFPHDLDEWQDLDIYYFQHKSLVIGGMVLCNGLALAGVALLGINPFSTLTLVSLPVFLISAGALLMVRGERASRALLLFTVLQYPAVSAISLISRS